MEPAKKNGLPGLIRQSNRMAGTAVKPKERRRNMAFMQVNYFSKTLLENVDLNVVIPTFDSADLSAGRSAARLPASGRFPVLYLLHGMYGDCTDWIRNTGIERYAQAANIAVIMPSAGNSFYTDMVHGGRYYTFISREIPALAEELFPVSAKREERYIAGLSMGGYGAFRIAFAEPERYSYAASLSGALAVEQLYQIALQKQQGNVQNIWEDAAHIRSTDSDLIYSFNSRRQQGQTMPRLFQACGTEDPLFEMNESMRAAFLASGADLTWHEEHGAHEWDFWDRNIKRVIDWLPRTGAEKAE
jgi:putative tributyrin esterase